jgi:hypothetical protein
MPIDTRPPTADQDAASLSATSPRHGGAVTTGIAAPPPEELLPSGDAFVPAPSPAPVSGTTPQRALAQDALRLLRRVRDPDRRPERWLDADIARDIALIRRHLAPLRSRQALAASFVREAFHVHDDTPTQAGPRSTANLGDPGPVRLAYAIRWLELGDGQERPPWPRLLAAG